MVSSPHRPPPPPKLRYEVYVCTTAEREYALEAWRVLDPVEALVPARDRQHKITCVPTVPLVMVRAIRASTLSSLLDGICILHASAHARMHAIV